MSDKKIFSFSEKLVQLEDSLNELKHSENTNKLSAEDLRKIDEIILEIKSISHNSSANIIAPVFLHILRSITNLLAH
jgi:hypothetical protein